MDMKKTLVIKLDLKMIDPETWDDDWREFKDKLKQFLDNHANEEYRLFEDEWSL